MVKTYAEGRWWNKVLNIMSQTLCSNEAGDKFSQAETMHERVSLLEIRIRKALGPVNGRGSQAGAQDEHPCVSQRFKL